MTKVLITGVTGFVGKATAAKLQLAYDVVAPVRVHPVDILRNVNYPLIDDISTLTGAGDFFVGVTTVIHVAAKAHIAGLSLTEFRQVNTEATLNLAKASAASGVKRFIFLSSIGVNGTSNTHPFGINDKPAPTEEYAVSKLEAEIGLKQIALDTNMELVIIRPPLVYGAQAPGNFGKLTKLVQRNLPLPLGAVNNKRSLIALENLVDLIIICIEHPKAANQTFLVSDDEDVSTTELLKMMTRAAGKKPRLIPVPVVWLKLAGKLTGKQAVINRLCGNLQVDISHTKNTLGWKPPITVEEGIARCFPSGGID